MKPDEVDDSPRCDGGCRGAPATSCPLCGGMWCGDCWDGIGWQHLAEERKLTRDAFALYERGRVMSDTQIDDGFAQVYALAEATDSWDGLAVLVRERWFVETQPMLLARALLAERRWRTLEGIERVAPLRASLLRFVAAWWATLTDEFRPVLRSSARKAQFARDPHAAKTRPRSRGPHRSPVASSAYDEVTLS
jgi:hypothetical protein